jgi:hypothetical protein
VALTVRRPGRVRGGVARRVFGLVGNKIKKREGKRNDV